MEARGAQGVYVEIKYPTDPGQCSPPPQTCDLHARLSPLPVALTLGPPPPGCRVLDRPPDLSEPKAGAILLIPAHLIGLWWAYPN